METTTHSHSIPVHGESSRYTTYAQQLSSSDDNDQGRRWWLWAICALLALTGYVARDYPAWRAKQLAIATASVSSDSSRATNDGPSKQQDDRLGSSPSSPSAIAGSKDDKSPWPMQFSVRWIPFMPFALVYLLAKVAWSLFRWLVFHTLWFIERSSIHVALVVEKTAIFAVQRGPDIVNKYLVIPIQHATNFVWQSVVLDWCRPTLEQVVLPFVVRTYSVVQQATVKHYHSLVAFMTRWVDPVVQTMTWVATELIYQPVMSVGRRLAVVGQTFVHTAKVYLQELAKDVMDLLRLVRWAGQWLWNKALRPLGDVLVRSSKSAATLMLTATQKLAMSVYYSILLPLWDTIVKAVAIIRSHPTLLAGIQALSAKAKAEASKVLNRIEEVNWLLLLESILTTSFTFLYKLASQTLNLAGKAISYFFVEMIPNAYQDLLNAIEFMRPIVEWIVLKVLAIVRPCWQITVWLAQTIAANAVPFLALLDKNIWTPCVQGWQTWIQPGLTKFAAMTIQAAVGLVQMVRQVVPLVSMVLAPLWKVVVEISDMLSRMATELGRVLLSMTGQFGVRVQQTVQEMMPQFEAAKAYMGRVLDDMVVWANDAMVDWVKKEKRD